MESTGSVGPTERNVDIERGEQAYNAGGGESVCGVISVLMSFLMCLCFGLLSSASAGVLLQHARRPLQICIFLDSSAISVGLTNPSFMTVLSCFM